MNCNRVHIFSVFTSLIFFLLLLSGLASAKNVTPKVIEGIVDLSDYDFENSRNVSLRGKWKYYPDKFLTIQEINNSDDWCLVEVPKNLKDQLYKNEKIKVHGYGSYYLKVIVNPEIIGKKFLFRTNSISTASVIYVNGNPVGQNGVISETVNGSEPEMEVIFNEFAIDNDTLNIIIHVSNFSISKFGLYYNIEMGLSEKIISSDKTLIAKDLFIIGGIVLMMIYHLVLFFLRKKEKSNLFFAIGCFAIAYYSLSLSKGLFNVLPDLGFEAECILKRIALFLALPTLSLYFYHAQKQDFSKTILKIIIVICSLFILAVIILDLKITDSFIIYFRYIGMIITCYLLFVVVKAMIKKRDGAMILTIGISVMLVSIINDALHNSQTIHSTDLMPAGMFFFLFLQSYLLAVRFNKSFVMTEKLTEELTYINKNLEKLVDERTEEIRWQKKEIEEKNEELNQLVEEVSSQRDEIEAQRDLVTGQKEQIEEIHHEVTQSIDYAKRLQTAILPDPEIIRQNVSDFFVLFRPRDNVSGDFYWWANVEGHTVITAVDCTGHGVPGAFMSMLGISFLREIVLKEYITHPGVVLRRMRKEIIRSLKQKGISGEQKDGMDMSLVSIDHEKNLMQFAGANNPLYFIRDRVLTEYKPDKMPIAIYDRMDNYTVHEIPLLQDDQFYMFSDGYADQFGGPKGKKFMYKRFKEFLMEISNKPLNEQKIILEKEFIDWKTGFEQIDDVVVLGIKI